VGRLSRDYEEDSRRAIVTKTVADASIVALATANALEIDIQNEFEETFGISDIDNIDGWLEIVDTTEEDMNVAEVREWLFPRLAMKTGELANGLESLDHLESVNLRELFEENVVAILSFLMVASAELDEDWSNLIEKRWDEIEQNSIL
jgi:hypothetical protein